MGAGDIHKFACTASPCGQGAALRGQEHSSRRGLSENSPSFCQAVQGLVAARSKASLAAVGNIMCLVSDWDGQGAISPRERCGRRQQAEFCSSCCVASRSCFALLLRPISHSTAIQTPFNRASENPTKQLIKRGKGVRDAVAEAVATPSPVWLMRVRGATLLRPEVFHGSVPRRRALVVSN